MYEYNYKLSILTENNNKYVFSKNEFWKFYAKVKELLTLDEIYSVALLDENDFVADEIYREVYFNNDSFLIAILDTICECETIGEQDE